LTDVLSGIRTFMRAHHPHADGINRDDYLREVAPDLDAIIVGIPFDSTTTNRPGARMAPAAIRDASFMLCDGLNPYTGTNVMDTHQIDDMGDLKVFNGMSPETMRSIEIGASQLINIGKPKLLSFGGDHSVTLPLLAAHSKKYGKLALVHFDAHLDTWSGSPDHSNFLRHAIELGYVDGEKVVQFGIRSAAPMEVTQWARSAGIITVSNLDFFERTEADLLGLVRTWTKDTPTYVTFDIDAIEPSQAPGTGTPEPAGLPTHRVLPMLARLPCNIIGADVVEVSPPYDVSQLTSVTAALIGWTLLNKILS